MSGEQQTSFSSALPVIVYSRPHAAPGIDWQEVDRGPGYFHIPAGEEVGVRIKSIDDAVLEALVKELQGVDALRYLDLSENRNVTNDGLAALHHLPQLEGLNLSSCGITSTGLAALKAMPNLKWLILTYCNKLTDAALKTLESMPALEYADMKGCPGITRGGLARVRRRGLTITR